MDGGPREALPHLDRADAFWRQLDAESRWAGEAALWLGRAQAALGHPDAPATLTRGRRLLASRPPATAASPP